MSIKVTGDKEVIRYYNSIAPGLRSKLVESIGSLTLQLKRKVMFEKLTGQALKVRTGTLRRSIDHAVLSNASGVVGNVGTNVFYGLIHEYGGQVTIPQHLRLVKQVFGKELKTPVWATVRSRQVTYPMRSFLRTSLDEMKQDFFKEMERISNES